MVASSSAALLSLIVDFEWKELFWHRREELAVKVRFLAFGHALLEQALDPYLGMVAKTVFVPVDDLFAMLPPEAQVARADALLADALRAPVALRLAESDGAAAGAGYSGLAPRHRAEPYYDDREHFRAKRDAVISAR